MALAREWQLESRNENRDLQGLLAERRVGRHLGGRGGAVEGAMEGAVKGFWVLRGRVPRIRAGRRLLEKPGEGTVVLAVERWRLKSAVSG